MFELKNSCALHKFYTIVAAVANKLMVPCDTFAMVEYMRTIPVEDDLL